MKSNLFLVGSLFASLVIFSCTKADVGPASKEPREFEEFEVALSLGGEMIEITQTPLTRANALPDSTLYVVAVFCSDTTSNAFSYYSSDSDYSGHKFDANSGEEDYFYAHGVFSNLSDVKLKVLSGKKYLIAVKAIVGGLDGIYHYNSPYKQDIEAAYYYEQGHLTNSFFYYGNDDVDKDDYTDVFFSKVRGKDRGTGSKTPYSTYYHNLETYYGECIMNASQMLSIVPVDMYYAMTSAEFEVNGLKDTDGIISVEMGEFTADLSYDCPKVGWKFPVHNLAYMLKRIAESQESTRGELVEASYSVTIDGVVYENTFTDKYYYFPRKKVTKFTINLDHERIVNNEKGFSLKLDENEFEENESYVFDDTIKE